MKKYRVIVSATNDLATDQRIKRLCGTLYKEGFVILLTGRILSDSLPLNDRPYKTRRVKHLFNRGVCFYAEYNIRLFFFLLFARYDILHANDLDTLPANYLAGLLRRKTLIYDSHEYFTEVPELNGRPRTKKIWEKTEQLIFPRLNHIITVNQSIAGIYNKKYGKLIHTIRNVPEKSKIPSASRKDFSLPGNKKLVILQGTGINRDRGAEEAVEAIDYVENAALVIAGKGDVIPELKKKVNRNPSLQEKVFFIPPMPYEKLMQLTRLCDCGLSLDKGNNLNYRYSLPNKLFDYIMAGIPVIVSDLPELRRIVEKYETGLITGTLSPKGIAEKINTLLYGMPGKNWRKNLDRAADDLNWEKEECKLLELYREIKEIAETSKIQPRKTLMKNE